MHRNNRLCLHFKSKNGSHVVYLSVYENNFIATILGYFLNNTIHLKYNPKTEWDLSTILPDTYLWHTEK